MDQFPAYATAPSDANTSALALRISRLEGRAGTLEQLTGTIATGPDSFPGGISFLGALSSPTGIIQLGANPGSIGPINVDPSSYSNQILHWDNGTVKGFIAHTAGGSLQFGSISSDPLRLFAQNIDRWQIVAEATGTATLQSDQASARIVGGSSNGLSIRNSANTNDNVRIFDNGSQMNLSDGTHTLVFGTNAASGELPTGPYLGAALSSSGISIIPNTAQSGTAAGVLGYWNGTQYYAAVQWAHVASGFGTLLLMKSGGPVVVGTDPTGTQLVRIGGALRISSTTLISTGTSFTNNAGSSAGTLTNAPSVGNPTKWIPIDDNGTTRNIPAW